jgi:hypothetical protein
MATSTVPALKAALLSLLSARAGLSGVQVVYGAPLPNPGREFISLAGTTGDQATASLGRLSREEEYRLTIYVSALREGLDQQSCTERAFALAAEVENAVRSDPTVSGTVRTALVDGPFTLEEGATDAHRTALVTLSLFCHARI